MAKDQVTPYWQICMVCDRRQYRADPVVCTCGTKMIDARDHPDNAPQKPAKAPQAPAKAGQAT